jgi:hypothetical protein
MNKIIWMCWWQGLNNECKGSDEYLVGRGVKHSLPDISRVCIDRWLSMNPDWEVRIVTRDTVGDYAPEFHDINNQAKHIFPPAHQSDLLRYILLARHGGVWADVSTYPMYPLSSFWDSIVNDTGFFAYRYMPMQVWRSGRATIDNWFLVCSEPGNALMEKWKDSYIDWYVRHKKWTKPKQYHKSYTLLTKLYETDKEVRGIVDGMVQIDSVVPHSARRGRALEPSYMYKVPDLEILGCND